MTSKSHGRTYKEAMAHLSITLKNLDTDHLDLWQVHDVRTPEDLEAIAAPGGALEAFREAKEKGWTRFIGVTGHHDPEVLRRALDLYEFDTVLLAGQPRGTPGPLLPAPGRGSPGPGPGGHRHEGALPGASAPDWRKSRGN